MPAGCQQGRIDGTFSRGRVEQRARRWPPPFPRVFLDAGGTLKSLRHLREGLKQLWVHREASEYEFPGGSALDENAIHDFTVSVSQWLHDCTTPTIGWRSQSPTPEEPGLVSAFPQYRSRNIASH